MDTAFGCGTSTYLANNMPTMQRWSKARHLACFRSQPNRLATANR